MQEIAITDIERLQKWPRQ